MSGPAKSPAEENFEHVWGRPREDAKSADTSTESAPSTDAPVDTRPEGQKFYDAIVAGYEERVRRQDAALDAERSRREAEESNEGGDS